MVSGMTIDLFAAAVPSLEQAQMESRRMKRIGSIFLSGSHCVSTTVTDRNLSAPLLNALQSAMSWVMKRTPLLYPFIMFVADRSAIIGV
jgi:hypothetical protein